MIDYQLPAPFSILRKFPIFPLLLAGLTACQPAAEQPVVAPPRAGTPTPARPAPAAPVGSPVQVAVRFFTWYQQTPVAADFLEVKARHLPDTTRYVVVNKEKANRYLAKLRSSGCLSGRFVARMRRLVWEQGDSLHPYDPGDAVLGFDADPILDSQDGEPYLSQIGQAAKTVRYLAPDRALVQVSYAKCPVRYPDKLFFVRRYPAGWLIDSLATAEQ